MNQVYAGASFTQYTKRHRIKWKCGNTLSDALLQLKTNYSYA